MTTQMQGSTSVIEREELLTTDEPADAAHIVKEPDDQSTTAHALVLEARIYGTPVEALCGWTWVPGKDAKALPVCEACLAIYRDAVDPNERDAGGGLPDA